MESFRNCFSNIESMLCHFQRDIRAVDELFQMFEVRHTFNPCGMCYQWNSSCLVYMKLLFHYSFVGSRGFDVYLVLAVASFLMSQQMEIFEVACDAGFALIKKSVFCNFLVLHVEL